MNRLPSAAHFKSNSTLSSSSSPPHSLVTSVVALSPVVAIGNDRPTNQPTGLDRLLLLSAHDHGSDAGERVDWMDGLSDEVILIGPGETR